MKKNIVPLSFAVLVIVGAAVAGAAYFHGRQDSVAVTDVHALLPKVSLSEIVSQSDGIIIGTVQATEAIREASVWRKNKQDILTNASIRVEKYLFNPKHLTSSEVTVQVIGGTIGTETFQAEDSPTFEKGQHVIVVIKQQGPELYSVYGWAQGKFTVNADGTVGRGDESAYFRDVFGKAMTVTELEGAIASATATPGAVR
ncbi:MAG: hypothetical protein RLZZ324_1310 [Candidatus Parcubacteria bacterium]|jgi:hypothetical protein